MKTDIVQQILKCGEKVDIMYDKYKDVFTQEEYDYIEDSLIPFINNFGEPRIYNDYEDGFYIYLENDNSPINYCHSIENLDGWLWGCVQGCRRMKSKLNKEGE